MKIRILVADDHSLFRMGLKSIIEQEPDMQLVAEASNGEEAVKLSQEYAPNVVIMDLMMPKLSGADATKAIIKASPNTKIILLSSFGDSPDMLRAISYGAFGALTKETPGENLLNAIRDVVTGKTVICDDIRNLRGQEQTAPSLTDRQSRILESVLNGLTSKEIASKLDITEDGVKKHLRAIFAKLNASSRSEAIAIALRKHLLKI